VVDHQNAGKADIILVKRVGLESDKRSDDEEPGPAINPDEVVHDLLFRPPRHHEPQAEERKR